MQDIKTEIVYGAGVSVTKQLVDETKSDNYLDHRKERAACDMGVKIAQEKGWKVTEEGGRVFIEMRLLVFTPNELKDYMHAKFKAKLQYMARNEEYLSDQQREALIMQSERF